MDQEPVVYAIADTHLGLREWAGHQDSPVIVTDFIRWLATETPYSISVLGKDAVVMRQLQPPTHLLMLGDILELWDSDNLPLLGSTAQVGASLDRLDTEKVYLLGNHDNILEEFASQDPLRSVEVVEDVYPPPDENGVVKPLPVGSRSYLFLHGHQFDETGTFSPLLSSIRQFGASLGAYAWVFLILTLGLGGWQGIFAWQGIDPPLPWAVFLAFVIALSLLWGPRFYMSWGRRIHRWVSGGRYKRKKSLRGLQAWWSDFQSQVRATNDLELVYGHTHFLDWIEVEPKSTLPPKRRREERDLVQSFQGSENQPQALYNISSWIQTGWQHGRVMWATFFYVDEHGPLLLGWNSSRMRPFHIPFEFIRKQRTREFGEREGERAAWLGWPYDRIRQWVEGEGI